jgi:hypothetical protein
MNRLATTTTPATTAVEHRKKTTSPSNLMAMIRSPDCIATSGRHDRGENLAAARIVDT